jgi:hypothetical protein
MHVKCRSYWFSLSAGLLDIYLSHLKYRLLIQANEISESGFYLIAMMN